MDKAALFVGIDLGTSGARVIIIDEHENVQASAKSELSKFGSNHRDPAIWWNACFEALETAIDQVPASNIRAISVDATSGTVLSVNAQGEPTSDGLMYNDPCPNPEFLNAVQRHSPAGSAARSGSGGLSCMLSLRTQQTSKFLHQADWINYCLSGRLFSDANNALKSGYDVTSSCWPEWLSGVGMEEKLLPDVGEPGTPIGVLTNAVAGRIGVGPDTQIIAGTTDGCASFVATGASQLGDAVTVLGTTLTIKILSERPISAPEYGIYSHKILGKWLAGGASNTGGGALLAHFTAPQLEALSRRIDPETNTGLSYYPLPKPGERFPICDPHYPNKTEPRPDDDADFLKALLEGISDIEAMAYSKIGSLGAPKIASLYTVGGGARNSKWSRIRQRKLGVRLAEPKSQEAAFGAALLAKLGFER